jgi:hypothetical protein
MIRNTNQKLKEPKMTSQDLTQRLVINGFEPVTRLDIESLSHIAMEQAETMGALFRAIARLVDDEEVAKLCRHGALQSDLQHNDIDVIRERTMKAGLIASEPAEV